MKKSYLIHLTITGFFLTAVLTGISSCGMNMQNGVEKKSYNTPKYIFYFIGDGMSIAQVNSAEALLEKADFEHKDLYGYKDGKLALSTFEHTGFSTTNALDRFITGSAAAGTALATGHKTTVNTISKNGSRTENLKTIAEMAKDKGLKVGIVSSVSIDHATPAVFYAHEDDRDNYRSIALQMAESGFDYFGGGFARGEFEKYGEGGVIAKMKESGYIVTASREEMNMVKPGEKLWAYTNYTPGDAALFYELDRKENASLSNDITLAEFTAKGIEMLENENGFFMMVEGGKIDWACHANDIVTMAYDVFAFDEAVQEAFEFYEKHPGETLIIVTADHECGGLTIGTTYKKYDNDFSLLKYQKISHELFELKESDWRESGNVTFSMALDSIEHYYGLGAEEKNANLALSVWETSVLKEAYDYSMSGKSNKPNEELKILYGGRQPLTTAVSHLLSIKSGFGWKSFSHTAVPVPVFAKGQGSFLFDGYYDNTDIPKKIIEIADIKTK